MAATHTGEPLGVADLAIVSCLERGTFSTREIADAILLIVKQAWADKHGYDIEWGSDFEPVGASLLACFEAREMGFKLSPREVGARLASLEKRGLVERIQIEGNRPMLWRLP
jgi:DNA-binding transcriptional ArsR family regulator